MYHVLENGDTQKPSVETYQIVEAEKSFEVKDVSDSYALVDPNTVMVESSHTDVAQGTVFRPSWFYEFTSRTNFVRKEHNRIKGKLGQAKFVSFLCDNSRIDGASTEKEEERGAE